MVEENGAHQNKIKLIKPKAKAIERIMDSKQ